MKLFQRIFQAALILVALVILYGIYMLIFPLKAETIKNSPFPVLTPQIKAGESLKIQADFCLHTNSSGKISRTLIGETIIILPPTESTLKKGCYNVVGSIVIPQGTPPGKYVLENLYKYEVNILKTIEVAAKTQEFEVIE